MRLHKCLRYDLLVPNHVSTPLNPPTPTPPQLFRFELFSLHSEIQGLQDLIVQHTGMELLFLCFYFISFLCGVQLSCNYVAVAASRNQILNFVLSVFQFQSFRVLELLCCILASIELGFLYFCLLFASQVVSGVCANKIF